MLVSIGCDHAGLDLKTTIMQGISFVEFLDRGCFANDPIDYPDVAKKVSGDIKSEIACFGILICGTGIGMSIAANREYSSRAALCYDIETARLSREHNDANILCLGARKTSAEEAIKICNEFFRQAFVGGRHLCRVDKLGEK